MKLSLPYRLMLDWRKYFGGSRRKFNGRTRLQFTVDSALAFGSMSPGARELLMKFIERTDRGVLPEAFIFEFDHLTLGYKHLRVFYRHRDELIVNSFIRTDGEKYSINPSMIIVPSYEQEKWFRAWCGMQRGAPTGLEDQHRREQEKSTEHQLQIIQHEINTEA